MKKVLFIIAAGLVVLLALSFMDYLMASIVGITASLFHASAFFYEHVYPYIIGAIISVTIAYPLSVLLLRKNKEVTTKILKYETKNHKSGIPA